MTKRIARHARWCFHTRLLAEGSHALAALAHVTLVLGRFGTALLCALLCLQAQQLLERHQLPVHLHTLFSHLCFDLCFEPLLAVQPLDDSRYSASRSNPITALSRSGWST